VARRLRQRGDPTPILMLTARDGVADRVAGLDVGADDYLVKPFALDELMARVRALLRRATGEAGELLRFADVQIDPRTREVTRGGRVVELTAKEYELLDFFMREPKVVHDRYRILDEVWRGEDVASNVLEVYVGYLRRKLGEPQLIQTVRGVGYTLKEAG
jgi:two-component system response regulator MprA